ncbi:MAG TPA: outer membrane beta-barrel protein [Bacteroidales bacterium]|jgi:opacity protein-like surface antigen|nr:outer membrane beta-barrel protein [Bacteroidales bacterium]HOS73319.1 outer membrane beta-barrel protein [Bacteroidales bacterium]HQH24026.1 outer membrane beta-barrel protein [Bacteroidales bacterium]HQJ82249.1 outer membrane beta-barrel protein [Bacteroidales bacterium]
MKTKVFFISALMAILPLGLVAQNSGKRSALEMNGALSLSSFFSGETVTGAGAEALFHYRLAKQLGIYGGWGYNVFRNDYPPAGYRCDFEETGYSIGLQYKHKIEFFNSSLFVRGGCLYKHIEIEDPSGELLFDTTHRPGWQAGCGIDIPVAEKWSIVSEARFSSLNERKAQTNTSPIPVRNYFSIRLGILKKF